MHFISVADENVLLSKQFAAFYISSFRAFDLDFTHLNIRKFSRIVK